MHYLDNASTTVVHPEVLRVVTHTLTEYYANPSSLYKPGMQAEQLVNKSRATLAAALGCSAREVFFTASGTESNNIALLGLTKARFTWGKHLIATGYEHPSVRKPLKILAKQYGFKLEWVQPQADGNIEIEQIANKVGKSTALVAAMHVNNETGALIDVAALANAVKANNKRTVVHVDGVQAFTKQPLQLAKTSIDSYAVSGHKLHAPKGIGALYLRHGLQMEPPFLGGSQEQGIRPGTENVAFIAAFAKAVELARQNMAESGKTIQKLKQQLTEGIEKLDGVVCNSPGDAWPGIVNISMPGVRSETMLHFLEQEEIYVSSGTTCSKGVPSHTLNAMGLPKERIDTALRISFSAQNVPEDVQAFLQALRLGLQTLARPAGNKGR